MHGSYGLILYFSVAYTAISAAMVFPSVIFPSRIISMASSSGKL